VKRLFKYAGPSAVFLTVVWMAIPHAHPVNVRRIPFNVCAIHGSAPKGNRDHLKESSNAPLRVTAGVSTRTIAFQGCSQRVGPFAGQDAAWRRWREAQGAGYSVSNGIFKCYDTELGEGWCFNVFYAC
jgi:hypothetical protein